MRRHRIYNGLVVAIAVFAGCCACIGCGNKPVGVVLTYEIDQKALGENRPVDFDSLVTVVNRRVRRVAHVRALDNKQLEVSVYGNPDASELALIKLLISSMAQIEFRILADPAQAKDSPIIDKAKAAPPNEKEIQLDGDTVAEWIKYNEREFGPSDKESKGMVKRMAGNVPEMLVLMDPLNVTGDYLVSATKGADEHGGSAIHLSFDEAGAARLEKLTSMNTPEPTSPGLYRHLGIILDKRLLSAPTIRSAISNRGMISGGSMTDREVETIIEILNAGSLPCAIRLVAEKRVTHEK
jgi:SecD/SecF fusion protein